VSDDGEEPGFGFAELVRAGALGKHSFPLDQDLLSLDRQLLTQICQFRL
jgi:hypothetical protein